MSFWGETNRLWYNRTFDSNQSRPYNLKMNNKTPPSSKKLWANLVIDIILPVLILNKLSGFLGEQGPLYSLLIALSLPFGHGLFDFLKEKKINWVSFLGLLNVLFTGGLALMKLEGIWFAIKEAGFPTLIGLFVFFFLLFKNPFVFLFPQSTGDFFHRKNPTTSPGI